jgi:hypothetical protein
MENDFFFFGDYGQYFGYWKLLFGREDVLVER